jgi:hypothetical protein
MEEGSVYVEGIDADVEETEQETQETEIDNPQQTEEVVESEQTQEQPQLTEKGTKLDPNPLSAAHQLLANEKRERERLQQILENPELFNQYAQGRGYQAPQVQPKVEPKMQFSADKLQTAEDVVNALNTLQQQFDGSTSEYKETISKLQAEVNRLSEGRQLEHTAHTIESDISRARETHPELNPKSPEYNPEVEKRISSLYHRFDFDPQSKRYMGKVSIADIADDVLGTSQALKDSGRKEAQTIIKDKSMAKVVTSAKPAQGVEEPTDAGAAIAQRIKGYF